MNIVCSISEKKKLVSNDYIRYTTYDMRHATCDIQHIPDELAALQCWVFIQKLLAKLIRNIYV